MKQPEKNKTESMESLLNLCPVPMVIVNDKDEFVFINESFTRLFGYGLTDLPDADHWFTLAYPDRAYRKEREHAWRQASQLFQRKIDFNARGRQATVTCKDDSNRIVEIYGANVGKSKNLIVYIDITDQKKAEEKQRLQSQILNQIHDSVIAVDLDGLITSWNKGSEKLFHYSGDESIGKHVSLLYPEYFHSYLRDDIIPTLLSQGNHEYKTTLLRKGGQEFTAIVSLSVLKAEDGEITGMIGYTLDVSEQERIQKALADSEQRLANIIDFLPDPTWVIDNNHRVIAWNLAIQRLTGIKKDEVIGQGDYAYAVPFYGNRRPVLIDLALRRNKKWEEKYLTLKEHNGILMESESFHPDMGDGGLYFAGTAGRIYNAEGDVVGAIETVRDITASKRSEQERERLIAELQDAISKVRTLSGMLPICSACKKIRDDKGYWNQIEAYIREHSEVDFSHSICPECVKKLYPDLDIEPEYNG